MKQLMGASFGVVSAKGEGMAMALGLIGAILSDSKYTLRQAARELGIDLKTLNKKLGQLGITAEKDPEDGRARILTGEQVQLLARHLETTKGVRQPALSFSLEDVAHQIVRDYISGANKSVQRAPLTPREQELSGRIDALERLVLALSSEIRVKLDELIAEGKLHPLASDPDVVAAVAQADSFLKGNASAADEGRDVPNKEKS